MQDAFWVTRDRTQYDVSRLFLASVPEDRKLTEDALQNLLNEKGDYDIIHRVIWQIKAFTGFAAKDSMAKGFLREVVGLTVEVTWLKRSEEERFQKEEMLRRAQDELDRRIQERTVELEQRTAQVVQQAKLLDLANDAIFVRAAMIEFLIGTKAGTIVRLGKEEAVGQSPHDLLRTEFPIAVSEILNSDRWEGELRAH